jgi:arylsulfatase A-like enzyme
MRYTTAVAVLTLLGLFAAPAPAADRPNVIVVLADDLGPGDLGCYGGPTPTPNFDRMAREGVRFTRYYSPAPICSPARCGLITGQFPARWRVTSYLQTRAGNRACEQADFLDPKAPTLPRALQAAGYKTAHVGKWHLGGGRDVAAPPKFAAYGYDLGLGTWESPEPHPDLTARDWIWSAADKIKRWERTGWMVDRTLEFLTAHPEAPCFVNLWLDDPHTPWVPSADDQQPGKDGRATGKGDTPARLLVLTEMDRQVGRLLDAIRGMKSTRPTVVLFLSDNGPLPSFDRKRTTGLPGSKLSLYEGGVRVPCTAWGPGVIPAGVANDATVFAGVDLFPTLCKLCGAEVPKGYESDGEDMTAALRGQTPRRTKPLVWEYGRNDTAFAYPVKKADRSPNLAVRDGDWKLLINADGTGAELYDLAADPKEAANLASAEPAVARRLTDAVRKWRQSVP